MPRTSISLESASFSLQFAQIFSADLWLYKAQSSSPASLPHRLSRPAENAALNRFLKATNHKPLVWSESLNNQQKAQLSFFLTTLPDCPGPSEFFSKA